MQKNHMVTMWGKNAVYTRVLHERIKKKKKKKSPVKINESRWTNKTRIMCKHKELFICKQSLIEHTWRM